MRVETLECESCDVAITAKVPPSLAERVEEYCEDCDIKRSTYLRNLILRDFTAKGLLRTHRKPDRRTLQAQWHLAHACRLFDEAMEDGVLDRLERDSITPHLNAAAHELWPTPAVQGELLHKPEVA